MSILTYFKNATILFLILFLIGCSTPSIPSISTPIIEKDVIEPILIKSEPVTYQPIEYGLPSTIKVQYFSYRINKSDCSKFLSRIPSKHFTGVKKLNFYLIDDSFSGMYFNGIITVKTGCDSGVFIHELAHHNSNHVSHTEWFYKKEAEIWQSLKS